MKTINAIFLRRKRACESQVLLFEQIFGESVEITRANCLKAAEAGLNLTWVAKKIFSKSTLNSYKKIATSIWAIYDKVMGITWDIYIKDKTIALNIIRTLQDAYAKEIATAFYNAWEEDN